MHQYSGFSGPLPGVAMKSRYLLWWQKKELEAARASQKEDVDAASRRESQNSLKVRTNPYWLS